MKSDSGTSNDIINRVFSRAFYLAGIDEAGRGPLAGPVSVAGVILPPEFDSTKINDSKKLKHEDRLEISEIIKENALAYECILISPEEIDSLNILKATLQGMDKVARGLKAQTQSNFIHFLVDGNKTFCNDLSVEAIIKGDGKVKCIGAASILAKVTRDTYMEEMAEQYPEYLFETHKGYPTKLHKEKIKEHGPCPIHRKTFAGVKEYCNAIDTSTRNTW